jgi:hypothetical protein
MMHPSPVPEARAADIIARVGEYMRKEHALYLPASDPLSAEWKSALQHYFPESLLGTVKTVALEGARIPPPPFYADAMAISSGNFPDFVHLASVTYIDVIVFNEKIAARTLFHGLVHAQQMHFLGFDTYVGLYVRGFLKTRSWLLIPLETQAFKLEERFLVSPREKFSVEEEVKLWARENRYA